MPATVTVWSLYQWIALLFPIDEDDDELNDNYHDDDDEAAIFAATEKKLMKVGIYVNIFVTAACLCITELQLLVSTGSVSKCNLFCLLWIYSMPFLF